MQSVSHTPPTPWPVRLVRCGLLLATAGALAACVSTPLQQADRAAQIQQANVPVQVPLTSPFDEAAAKRAMEPGPSEIRGVLYHRVTRHGKYAGEDKYLSVAPVQPMARIELSLYPDTEHLREYLTAVQDLRRARSRSKTAQNKQFIPHPRFTAHGMNTTTDEHGRFSFKGLKPGRYLISAAPQDLTSTGTEPVPSGTAVVTNGWYATQVQTYRQQNFQVVTPLAYEEFVDIKPGQGRVEVEARMRLSR